MQILARGGDMKMGAESLFLLEMETEMETKSVGLDGRV